VCCCAQPWSCNGASGGSLRGALLQPSSVEAAAQLPRAVEMPPVHDAAVQSQHAPLLSANATLKRPADNQGGDAHRVLHAAKAATPCHPHLVDGGSWEGRGRRRANGSVRQRDLRAVACVAGAPPPGAQRLAGARLSCRSRGAEPAPAAAQQGLGAQPSRAVIQGAPHRRVRRRAARGLGPAPRSPRPCGPTMALRCHICCNPLRSPFTRSTRGWPCVSRWGAAQPTTKKPAPSWPASSKRNISESGPRWAQRRGGLVRQHSRGRAAGDRQRASRAPA
jgi:hypothetical protein